MREPPRFSHGSLTLGLGVALSTYLARERQEQGTAKTRACVALVDPRYKPVLVYRADGIVAVLRIDESLTGDERLPVCSYPLRESRAED